MKTLGLIMVCLIFVTLLVVAAVELWWYLFAKWYRCPTCNCWWSRDSGVRWANEPEGSGYAPCRECPQCDQPMQL